MRSIILSIHPSFVDKILSGEKRFEFRKVLAKKKPQRLVIYSTSPISSVVAEADIEDILVDTPDNLWDKTSNYAGVDKIFFNEYFKNRQQGIAYQLTNITQYENPKSLKDYGLQNAPQSFVYI
ncbi:ASCH domain-containing protein [Sporolactobacillus shoreicorticis]|uniref:ASCH domain-containing protein n=1 Tax=Sporolactobacillus shoreicorticis TaxID=1923877 RepID=A0ABW5RYF0_9BACL|nr:ASCH domain-containing protein [Sporolactobacillus shoreicorticis]MCO7125158.1 ASCH domain-containing protein [Sporolactobacillus shoreicorticis]